MPKTRAPTIMQLSDDDMESNRTLPMPAIRLLKLQSCIVAANASSDARECLSGSKVAGAATKAICVPELDQGRIRERGSKWGLVGVSSLAGNRVSHANVALEDDVAWALLVLFLAAAPKEECKAAGLVLSPCGDVEAGERAFVVWCNDCCLAAWIRLVWLLDGDGQQERW